MKAKQLFEKLIENWHVKVICFIIAFFLYVFNQQSDMTSKTIKTNLTLEPNTGFMPSEAFIKNVAVSVRGKSKEINSISGSDVTAYIDFSYVAREGQYEFPVLLKLSETLTAMNPMEIKVTPEKIKLSVEEVTSGFAEISPLLKGNVPYGYEVKSVTMNPELVKIRGSRSIVENCKKVQTANIVLSNATKSFSNIVKLDTSRKNLIYEENNVNVTVEIDEKIERKELSSIPVTVVNLHDGLVIAGGQKNVKFSVEGPLLELDKLSVKGNLVRADFSHVSEPGTYDVKLHYFVPSSLKIMDGFVQNLTFVVEQGKDNSEEKITVVETAAGSLDEKID